MRVTNNQVSGKIAKYIEFVRKQVILRDRGNIGCDEGAQVFKLFKGW